MSQEEATTTCPRCNLSYFIQDDTETLRDSLADALDKGRTYETAFNEVLHVLTEIVNLYQADIGTVAEDDFFDTFARAKPVLDQYEGDDFW